MLAVLLSFVGLFAKLSAAPFHYWTPDAYEGAPPSTVAFVSTVPKIAGAVALVRRCRRSGALRSDLGLAHRRASHRWCSATSRPSRRPTCAVSWRTPASRTPAICCWASPRARWRAMSAVLYAVAYAVPSLGVMLVVAEEGPSLTT